MPRPLAAFLSALFFVATATVLALPVLTASNELVLWPVRFEGLVTKVSHPALSTQRYATLDEGVSDGRDWSLDVDERSSLCLSFSTDSRIGDAGLMCSEPVGRQVGPTQFIPASEALRRGVLLAVLPGEISELRLSATNDESLRGALYELPPNFRSEALVLVVFLPPGSDVVSATARAESGIRVDVSRLVDQVGAY